MSKFKIKKDIKAKEYKILVIWILLNLESILSNKHLIRPKNKKNIQNSETLNSREKSLDVKGLVFN